jgi:PilZ domain
MSTSRVRVIQSGAKSMPHDTTVADEKRWSRRKLSRTPGLIYPGGVAASIPCTIADQSGTGARLLMQPGWVNPFRGDSSLKQTFTLVIRLDRMMVDCQIVRLNENEMGVRFVSVPKPTGKKI